MFLYLVGVSLICAALGVCFSFVGGLVVLILLVIFSSCAVVALAMFANLSLLAPIAVCVACIVFLNLGWFCVVLFASIRSLFVFLRD